MSMTLTNGINIIEHSIVNGVDTPMYPVTRFKNVVDATGKQLNEYDFIPLPYDGTNYEGAASNALRFLGDDNSWRVIQDGTTSQKGVVQLYDGADSTSTALAATAASVKGVNDALTTFVGTTAPATYATLSQLGASGESLTTAQRQALFLPYLDANGLIDTKFLPSFVDDVIEGYLKAEDGKFYKEATYETEITAEAGKIYVNLSDMKTYRWGGSAYAVISETLAIGTTAGTAYEGSAGAALALRVDSLEAGNVVIKAKASTDAAYADNTLDDGKVSVTVGTGASATTYTLTVFDQTKVADFYDTDKETVVTDALASSDLTSTQQASLKASILTLIGENDGSNNFKMASATQDGLMSDEGFNKLANTKEIILTGSGVTTCPTFSDGTAGSNAGNGIWIQTVSVDA